MQDFPSEDPGIEALRGFAAMLVVVTHYAHLLTPQPGAWAFSSTGVDLFFVLSGFVFAPYLFGKPLQIGPHLVRRFFRMYPLYLCALLLYAVLKSTAGGAWEHFGVHLLMAHTLQSQEIAFFYNPAFWSLPPEVEFYLLLPLLAWLSRRIGFGSVLLLALAMHLALVFYPDSTTTGVGLRAVASVHFPGLLIEFFLGTLAYALVKRSAVTQTRCGGMALGLLALLALLGALLVFSRYLAGGTAAASPVPLWVSGNMGLMAAGGYMFLVACIADRCRTLSHGWVVACLWCGRLSYGIYLFHNASLPLVARYAPGLDGALALGANVVLTLLLAWTAHRAIEAPLRQWGRKLAKTLTVAPVARA